MSLTTGQLPPVRSFQHARPLGERTPLFGTATALPWLVGGCLTSTALYVAVDDPGDGDGGLTPCPIRALTGRWCPGCGLTRATHHLFRGNVAQAMSFNAAVPVVLAALVMLWATWLMVVTGRGVPQVVQRIKPAAYVAAAALLVCFTAIRNLSGAVILRGG